MVVTLEEDLGEEPERKMMIEDYWDFEMNIV
jgi:hypothetical protein